jgi:CheY-like chemotaxis protein
MSLKPNHLILIVEDSHEDFEAMTRSLKGSGLANPIMRCEDGDEALDYLHRRGRFADPESAPRPGMILLDLNLPATDGREVLAEIKTDPGLKSIPVVVLTSSHDPLDIDQCYAAGANSYIAKPVHLEGIVDALQRLKEYWFEIVVLPRVD